MLQVGQQVRVGNRLRNERESEIIMHTPTQMARHFILAVFPAQFCDHQNALTKPIPQANVSAILCHIGGSPKGNLSLFAKTGLANANLWQTSDPCLQEAPLRPGP